MDDTNKKKGIAGRVLIFFWILFLFACSTAYFSARWYINVFGDMGFDSVIFTLNSGLDKTSNEIMSDYMLHGLLYAVLLTAGVGMLLFFRGKRRPRGKARRAISALVSLALSLFLLYSAAEVSGLIEYVRNNRVQATVYEDYYVEPTDERIRFPEKKRNLVYIYMESMETTFFSREHGGGLDDMIIPGLYELAKDNVNFSHNDDVGGAAITSGSFWTIAAMVSHTTGLPLRLPVDIEGNTYGDYDNFLPGVRSLSDILHDQGYNQALMVGSDASFGGRDDFYLEHDTDTVYDLFTARADGLIPEDYYVWWGFEDKYLYSYAKEKLGEMAAQDEPFAFTMLTVDTHHIGGYVCDLCEEEYAEQYENVYACADRQIIEFLDWLRQQDFYENTTVIITGDHCSMDADFFLRNTEEGYQRHVYNCFLNAAAEPHETRNRVFTTLDMFPSTLAAMGCEIEGHRLGLGTDLFSDRPTLAEEKGFPWLDWQISLASMFYLTHFMG